MQSLVEICPLRLSSLTAGYIDAQLSADKKSLQRITHHTKQHAINTCKTLFLMLSSLKCEFYHNAEGKFHQRFNFQVLVCGLSSSSFIKLENK
ncbi:hypothetical protein T07_9045 [Trichinella nelsoni]|uniref:Uncharacterized protein n=1 Tax=Trichinella nelsoni TaxID=6336 RepID=A0A0V0S056_9BILA|nr:hypothetical protein T07_9045 [Trichinella nelsoni]